jgi:hypothetical protein
MLRNLATYGSRINIFESKSGGVRKAKRQTMRWQGNIE